MLSPAIVPYHYRMADPSGAAPCRKCAGKGARTGRRFQRWCERAFRSARSGSPSRRAVTATACSFLSSFRFSFGRCVELLVLVDLVYRVSSLATVSPRFLSISPPFSMVFQATPTGARTCTQLTGWQPPKMLGVRTGACPVAWSSALIVCVIKLFSRLMKLHHSLFLPCQQN